MLVVVLSFDSIATRLLGPYGNERALTPGFDHLASASLVFGNARTTSVAEDAIHALLSGRQVWPGREDGDPWIDWRTLVENGIGAEMVVEAPSMQIPEGLPDSVSVTAVDGQDGPDTEEFETPFAQLVAEARRRIEVHEPVANRVLWLKSRGVPVPWTPPLGFLDLEDEDDDFDEFEEKSFEDDGDTDADEEVVDDRAIDSYQDWVFSAGEHGAEEPIALDEDDWDISLAGYTGYLRHLDQQLMELAAALADVDDQVVWVMTAAEGRELNERQGLDTPPIQLNASRLNVPMVILGPSLCEPGHCPGMVSTTDVMATVMDAFELTTAGDGQSLIPDTPAEMPRTRECLAYSADGERAFENAEFRLVLRDASETASELLFVKPDDHWDNLDVAGQEHDEVERLGTQLDTWAAELDQSDTEDEPDE